MAKKNPGDILTCDWNPVIGCKRYSTGCRNCWYLDGIFPWQQRLGRIPADVQPDHAHIFENRLTPEYLRTKGGIVGICQHGDLFWDRISDDTIHRVFDVIEAAVKLKRKQPTYLFWTKRAERMADIVASRYPDGAPVYMAFAVSVEDKRSVTDRLPHLARISGKTAIAAEPLLEEISIAPYLTDIDWVIVGSETGRKSRPLDKNWVRRLRDETKAADLPFFIKQLGSRHDVQERELDGREWSEFPEGMEK